MPENEHNYPVPRENAIVRLLFSLIPRCFRRFPDGTCFYLAEGRLSMLNRKEFRGWYFCTWDELWKMYRKYWKQLPVRLPGEYVRNWWR